METTSAGCWALGSLTIVALLGLLAWGNVQSRQRKVLQVFAGRETLTDAQFFEKYFRQKGVTEAVASGVRRILAEQFGENMSRLSAYDDFTENLKFLFDSDSLVDVEIVLAIEDEFKIKFSDAEAQNLRTVEDVVLGITRKIEHRNQTG